MELLCRPGPMLMDAGCKGLTPGPLEAGIIVVLHCRDRSAGTERNGDRPGGEDDQRQDRTAPR
jgi:hypothetical protein